MIDQLRAGVLTISDRCSRGEMADTSGPALCDCLRDDLRAQVEHTAVLPDDAARIEATLREWVRAEPAPDLIITTGGTGLGPRDITPEAAGRLIERDAPGLMELARLRCCARTPLAALSRGVAGVAGRTLIITLPGSRRGAVETLQALTEVIPHAIEILRGGQHDEPSGG
jgi:molybdenum cofactor synthesis domain-containing protein